MKTRRYFVLIYFFLLFIFGCQVSGNLPRYNIGDRVYVPSQSVENSDPPKVLGVIVAINSESSLNRYSYTIYCNNNFSDYLEPRIELVDPMPRSEIEVIGEEGPKGRAFH